MSVAHGGRRRNLANVPHGKGGKIRPATATLHARRSYAPPAGRELRARLRPQSMHNFGCAIRWRSAATPPVSPLLRSNLAGWDFPAQNSPPPSIHSSSFQLIVASLLRLISPPSLISFSGG